MEAEPMNDMSAPGHLAENVAHFARALRKAGLKIGSGAVLEAVEALTISGAIARDDLYWTLHAIFVKRHEDRAVFDQAFRIFFRRRALMEKMMAMLSPESPGAPEPAKKPEAAALRVADAFAGDVARENEEIRDLTEFTATMTLSDTERLKTRDFAQMSAEEVLAARRLISELTLPDDRIRTRRMIADLRGARPDLRATLRRAMRQGGEIIRLERKRPRLAHPPIVALIDISGSMAEYSRILLHFLHELAARRGRVHSFVFGTRLTNITRLMRAKDPDEALALCGCAAPDWEGGTRISAALHAFNRDWSRRVLSGSPILLLFTDGLEREGEAGGPSLTFEMDRLHRSCRRLIWLNPLLRFDGFAARAGGVRAMLPHVDEFRPIHNLASMGALCQALDAARNRDADPRRWLSAA
jgi:uncharacterized protein with von Willebrand factor type A (vWA) domain